MNKTLREAIIRLIRAYSPGIAAQATAGNPAGTDKQFQVNNAGAFGGTSGMEWNGGTQQIAFTGDARFKKTIQFEGLITVPIDIGDEKYITFETPLDWDASTDMTIKFRWDCEEAYATNSAEVCFEMNVSTAPLGTQLTGITGIPFSSGDINIPATQGGLAETSFVIDKDEIDAGNTILIAILREYIADGNDPVADVYLVSVRLEYTANRLGDAV